MTDANNSGAAESLSSLPKAPRRKRKALIGIAISLLLLFAAIWWLPRPNVVDQPVEYVRNADGTFSQTSEAGDSGLELAMDVGQLSATNSVAMTSSSSHSGPAWFACNSILVMNQSDHLLVQQAADRLVEELKDSGQFQSVQYYPTGHQPKPGIRKPDLYLTLNLGSLEETGIASTEIAAVINANLGVAPARSTHSYFDSQSLPMVSFNANLKLNHRSTFAGLESSGAKFRTQAASIAEALAKQITNKVDGLKKKYSESRPLPKSMIPEWEKADQFQFLEQFHAKQIVSTHGPFLKNETFWRVQGVNVGQDLVDAIHEELKAEHWQGKPSGGESPYLRMSRDGQILTVFADPQDLSLDRPADSEAELTIDRFWIHNQSLLTKKERQAAFDDLLTEEPINLSTLLALKAMATPAQMSQVIEQLKENPPVTQAGWVELAKHFFAKKQQDKGIAAIQCAHVLNLLKHASDSEIRSVVKNQKLVRSKVLVVTAESLDTLGIVNANQLTKPVELEIGPGRMAAVASENSDGTWNLLGLMFGAENPATGGTVEYTLTRVASYGASWSTGTWHHSGDHERIEKLGDIQVKLKTIQEQGTRYPSKVIFSSVAKPAAVK